MQNPNEPLQPKGALSVTQAMEYLSVKRTKFYSLVSSGELKARKCGRKTLVLAEDIKSFLEGLETLPVKKNGEGR